MTTRIAADGARVVPLPNTHPTTHRMGRFRVIDGRLVRYCLERLCNYGEELVGQ